MPNRIAACRSEDESASAELEPPEGFDMSHAKAPSVFVRESAQASRHSWAFGGRAAPWVEISTISAFAAAWMA